MIDSRLVPHSGFLEATMSVALEAKSLTPKVFKCPCSLGVAFGIPFLGKNLHSTGT